MDFNVSNGCKDNFTTADASALAIPFFTPFGKLEISGRGSATDDRFFPSWEAAIFTVNDFVGIALHSEKKTNKNMDRKSTVTRILLTVRINQQIRGIRFTPDYSIIANAISIFT